MTPGTHARAEPEPAGAGRPGRSRLGWRLGTPLVVLVSGALFAVSATNSAGTDLRPGRYTDLASLVEAEAEQYAALEDRVQTLSAEVEALTGAVGDGAVSRLQRRVEVLEDPAGLTPRSGPGVTVTLSDSPEELIDAVYAAKGDLRPYVVHQQDIQAVVNAMWRAGATAVTVQGQRIVSTTGIKCEGNSVQLQGVPYPQPYVISAVGDQGSLLTAIEADPYLQLYRSQAVDPEIQIGWSLALDDRLVAPAYDGLLDVGYAEPIR